jgi:exodeoxyribonuclease V beta subunit
MTDTPAPLDPLTLPLRGSRLIEASAGTGKTWTIAALVVRLVLGHGVPGRTAFERPLVPAEILVMTFTVAATRELSDRIRARLVQAARHFRGEEGDGAADPFLVALAADFADPAARRAAAHRLALAADAMDEAAVLTIDAWCQRMLHEHAFDSGSAWDEVLQPDETELRAEAVRDYWRQEVYPLDGATLEAVLRVWPKGVGGLSKDVERLLPHVREAAQDAPSLATCCARALGEQREALRTIKAGWTARVARMRAWLEDMLGAEPSPFNRTKLQLARTQGWLDALAAWAGDPDAAAFPEGLSDAARRRLTPEGLRDALRGPTALDVPPEFAAFADLDARVQAWADPMQSLRLHAAAHVARQLRLLKARAGTFGFADLLERLESALAGAGGERLRARIAAQFPAVLVDEFQDTSPRQYRILDRLYDIAADAPTSALFLIGDPKQSIYGFRGADLDSYLRARDATRGRHAVLDTNRRSTVDVVAAVNRLFAHAETSSPLGAFRAPAGVPFEPVRAQGRLEAFMDADGPRPALEAVVAPAAEPGARMLPRFAALCAEDVVARLDDASAGFAGSDGAWRRLRPGDIAILVRTGKEAEAVRRALRQRGVHSVYLSDRDSVFATPEAPDLLRWLRAVADPLDGRAARAGWATAFAGLPLTALAALRRDDVAFEARVDTLRTLQGTWRRQGVLPMLRQSLHALGLPARWLSEPGGERRLTNVLHLAELMQAAAAGLEGEHALVRWLHERLGDVMAGGEDALVRLESDADLVQVVTGHKAKGLEYPVVYLPFAATFRGAEKDRQNFVTAPDLEAPSGRRVVLGTSARPGDASDEARLQEDLRWLYVALTRARHALWLGVGPIAEGRGKASTLARSALGWLLGASDDLDPAALPARVAEVLGGLDGVSVVEPDDEPDFTRLRRVEAAAPLVDAPPFAARFDRGWTLGSFSALVRDLAAEPAPRVVADATREARWQELVADEGVTGDGAPATAASSEVAAAPNDSNGPEGADVRDDEASFDAAGARVPAVGAGAVARAAAHRFPRGALPGNFLHDQLEWLAGAGFALGSDASVREQLARRCERDGWGARAEDVVEWLSRVVATPLPPLGASLASLETVRPELEFWLPGEGGHASALDALCRRHLMPGLPRPALPARSLRGMLMGFADLVIEHAGRWWVLDYKSNALGTSDADYHRDALEGAMAAHRYDVQAAIYLLALHRLLRSRLGGRYDPSRHLGGAVFLFLRGIDGPEAGCVHLAPPAEMLESLDRLLAGGEEETA